MQRRKQVSFFNFKWGMCQSKFWHKKPGHLKIKDLSNTTDEASQALDFCETCALGKFSKKPVPKVSDNKAVEIMDRIFSWRYLAGYSIKYRWQQKCN